MSDPGSSSVHVSVPLGSDAPKKKWPNYAVKSADSDGTEEPLIGDGNPPLNNTEAGIIKAAFEDYVEKSGPGKPVDAVKKSFIARAVNAVKAAIRKANNEPRRVSTVAVTHGGKLLMGKRRDNGKWTVPGGHVDPGEDHHAGAVRELREESGLHADSLMPLSNVIEKTDGAGKSLHVQVFHHALDGDRPPTTMQDDPDGEVERWKWIDISEGLPEDIRDNLHVPLERNALMGALGLDDGEYNDHPDEIRKGGYADPATADDAEPLDGYDDGGTVPVDALSAINALGYAWTDLPTSTAVSRAAGYPSQGGAITKGGPGSTRWGGGKMHSPNDSGGGDDLGSKSKTPVPPVAERIKAGKAIGGGRTELALGRSPGKTKSGKEIQPTADHPLHSDFSEADHADAAAAHDNAFNAAKAKFAAEDKAVAKMTRNAKERRSEVVTTSPEDRQRVLVHHQEQSNAHEEKAGASTKEQAITDLVKATVDAHAAGDTAMRDIHVKNLKDLGVDQAEFNRRRNIKKSAFETLVPISKADKKRQIVYCVVLAPDDVDLQTDIMHAEDIEETAHNYLKDSRVIGDNHTEPLGAYPVESYIAPCDFEITDGQYGSQKVKKGSWIIGIKIVDPKAWAKVEAGEYQGVSVGGYGLRDEIT